jgi:hypothetical protein
MFLAPIREGGGRCELSSRRRPSTDVEQIFMLVSHVTRCKTVGSLDGCVADRADAQLLEMSVRELLHMPSTGVWLSLYSVGYENVSRVRLAGSSSPQSNAAGTCTGTCADGIYVWGEKAIWKRYPRLAEALKTHPYMQREVSYLQKYYWFHAALNLWFAAFGACSPHVRYIWRLETDVVWTGSLDQLILLSNDDTADVLLPPTFAEGKSRLARGYYHFGYQTFLKDVPMDKHVFALVCVGRYSKHFLTNVMDNRWSQGIGGYEEVLLPTTCLNTTGCRLSQFSGWTNVAGNHVRFRVNDPSPTGGPTPRKWECKEYLDSRKLKGGTLDLWHPVKDRGCIFEYLGIRADENFGLDGQNCTCDAVPLMQNTSEASGSLRSLRRRSIAWAERWKQKEEKERPYVALLKANEAMARNQSSSTRRWR